MRKLALFVSSLFLFIACGQLNNRNANKAARSVEVRQINPGQIKGTWYLNKWTMYHTLIFSDSTLFADNHIDSVFTLNYSTAGDTLILRGSDSKIAYAQKIIAFSNDTLIIKSFDGSGDTLWYSKTKRPWKN